MLDGSSVGSLVGGTLVEIDIESSDDIINLWHDIHDEEVMVVP